MLNCWDTRTTTTRDTPWQSSAIAMARTGLPSNQAYDVYANFNQSFEVPKLGSQQIGVYGFFGQSPTYFQTSGGNPDSRYGAGKPELLPTRRIRTLVRRQIRFLHVLHARIRQRISRQWCCGQPAAELCRSVRQHRPGTADLSRPLQSDSAMDGDRAGTNWLGCRGRRIRVIPQQRGQSGHLDGWLSLVSDHESAGRLGLDARIFPHHQSAALRRCRAGTTSATVI